MGYLDKYKDSVHIGEIKERIEIDIKVERMIPFENEFGSKKIYTISSGSNYIVWFCSGNGIPEDFVGKIKCTIKDHVVYKNINQTIINRAVICK